MQKGKPNLCFSIFITFVAYIFRTEAEEKSSFSMHENKMQFSDSDLNFKFSIRSQNKTVNFMAKKMNFRHLY